MNEEVSKVLYVQNIADEEEHLITSLKNSNLTDDISAIY